MNRIFLLSLVLVLGMQCQKPEAATEEEDRTNVEVLQIFSENAKAFFDHSVVLRPVNSVMVFPEAMGKLEKIYAREGSFVKAGEALGKIEDLDYKLALTQAGAMVSLAQASEKNAKSNLDRQLKLQDEGFGSDAQLEGLQTAWEVAAAQLRQAESGMAQAQRAFDRTVITSPIDGYVSARNLDIGHMASNTMPAFVVDKLKVLKANIAVGLEEMQAVSEASEVIFTIPGFDGQFSGKLLFRGLAPSADGSYPITVHLQNSMLKIPAGRTASVRIFGSDSSQLLAIPGFALQQKNGEWLAYSLNENTAIQHQLELMGTIDDKVFIRSGLDSGAKLIVRGHNYCKDGEPVSVQQEWSSIDEFLATQK